MEEIIGYLILTVICIAVNRIMVKAAYDKGRSEAYEHANALLEIGMRKIKEEKNG